MACHACEVSAAAASRANRMAPVMVLGGKAKNNQPALPPPDDEDDEAPSLLSLSKAFQPFTVDRQKQIEAAKVSSTLKRIIKTTVITEGVTKYMRKGQYVKVENFSLWESRKQLHNYGCSVAVTLYLNFQLECAGMFLLMLLLAIPALASNGSRQAVRRRTRRQSPQSVRALDHSRKDDRTIHTRTTVPRAFGWPSPHATEATGVRSDDR